MKDRADLVAGLIRKAESDLLAMRKQRKTKENKGDVLLFTIMLCSGKVDGEAEK